MTQIYKVGTATVTNGQTAVAGDDTGWATALVTAGLFTKDGLSVPIESVTDEDTLVLALPWPGDTGTGAYAIMRENSGASSVVDLYDRLRQATITLSLHSIHPNFIGTLAEIEALNLTPEDTEFVAARLEDGQPDEYYRWGGTDWVGPFPIHEAGPAGVGEGGYGLPAGGTTGQVLAKASGADGDSEWIDTAGAAVDITVTPAGNIAATNVQAALVELDSEKAAVTAIREKLTANRSYYVRTDGSDSNNGLANTAGGAFLTIQRALNVVAALDLSIYDVTINVADGIYTGANTITGPWVGSGDVTISGNTTTPANVLLNVTGTCIQAQSGARVKVRGLKLQASSIGLYAVRNSYIEVTGLMDFGACSSYHAFAEAGARIQFLANWNTTGGAFASLGGQAGGTMSIASRSTTITNTPAWGSAYASFTLNALLVANSFTFSGSSTGARYSALTGGGIATFGGGASYFPGNAAGSATSPGWYT